MERFISPMPLPTAREAEILTILIEECAEVQQRATKLMRFGRDEVQPGQALTNAERLSLEVGDLVAMIDMARTAGLVSDERIETGRHKKFARLLKYMQTATTD